MRRIRFRAAASRIADLGTFTDAVRRVANGGSAIDSEVVGLLLGRRRHEDQLAALTARCWA
jgi:hypothetical protein